LSVTGFVHTFFPKFEADKIIDKMMMSRNWENSPYFGMEKDEIKEQWRLNGYEASQLGTKLHNDIELFYNDIDVENDSEEFEHFDQFHKDHKHLKPFRTEWEIYDEELRLAGSVDMVFCDEDGKYFICDWKRSKDIKENNQYEEGTYPISHLPHANYWHYSLQLNIYKKLLEKCYGITIEGMFLVQCHPNLDTYKKHECVDLSEEVEDLFKLRLDQI